MTKSTDSVNGGAMPGTDRNSVAIHDRRQFIGGSDARTIMGKDEKALHRLWQEKRGEVAPLDLSGVLIVQLGLVSQPVRHAMQIGLDLQPRSAAESCAIDLQIGPKLRGQ